MLVNYEFIPESKSAELKAKSDMLSYAGKLLEIVGQRTLIVGVDNNDRPFIYACSGRLLDAFDMECKDSPF